MFDKVLVANRGAIACRIMRTLRRMGIQSVAVYSEADAESLHVREADQALCIGAGPAHESYLCAEKLLAVARQTGAQAIHPGYGFLSENAAFAESCASSGICFIGPTPTQMREFGLKHTARQLAEANGVPLLPGSGLLTSLAHAQTEAVRIGFPVMLKATAGGGGIGMRLIREAGALAEAYQSVERLVGANFNDAGIYLEKYVEHARHIEVQIFGDGRGAVVALGERDCSIQRRNQKVIEEAPAPGLNDLHRQALLDSAVRLGRAVSYRSAGTVEFVYDVVASTFYFLEVNTRLQVEHGVTEAVTGVDLVEWMVRLTAGVLPPLETLAIVPSGAAIQVRLYAEDPHKDFQPSSGQLTEARFPEDVRVDTWIERGITISPYYDPMLAKIIASGRSREEARARMATALACTHVAGLETNLAYLQRVLADAVFVQGKQTTRYLKTFAYRPDTIDVLSSGIQSTLQDYPGRLGYWAVGVPPSGPMDAFAARVGNRLLGNPANAACLEMTLNGPTLLFNGTTTIALTGAAMEATLDDVPLAYWVTQEVSAGSTLRLGAIGGGGSRAYLCVAGGFDVPDYLGSKATFTLGKFGGHAGRPLRIGDVLHRTTTSAVKAARLPPSMIPAYPAHWDIDVLYGPHGAPDFFTDKDIQTFFSVDWKVHHNSSRTGVRLIGPKPVWARPDGGEAGLHPSNIHDNAYAIGAIDFTGDMPVILGPDGPSLGGFVCPATVIQAELWKIGQLRPGNTVRFHRVSMEVAIQRRRAQDFAIARLQPAAESRSAHLPFRVTHNAVSHMLPPQDCRPAVVYRTAGDAYLLIEYGELKLDLELRFRVHALMQWLEARQLPGMIDVTPGIRSLQIHYNNRDLPLHALMDALVAAESELPAVAEMVVPTRVVHLPLSWNDSAARLAVGKYMQSVRKNAPWCPDNIEFIRRINGLDDVAAVKDIVFSAHYLVMGLGDVYLGAPVATPIDPRHRLVTTKYNPARTWTPENAVGIGGAYMCVYGMEGPGGYQLIGRTVQMWNRYKVSPDFAPGKPWLLRFFDQIKFYPVSEQALADLRADFIAGRAKLSIEEKTFSLRDYNHFLDENAASIAAFKSRQRAAFDAERERWEYTGQANYAAPEDMQFDEPNEQLPQNSRAVESPVAGSIWKIKVEEGDQVGAGDVLIVIESMKMEINVTAPAAGQIARLFCHEGSQVIAGQPLAALLLASVA